MTGTLDDVAWGKALTDIGGSFVRACLEDALIDVDVQRLSSPESRGSPLPSKGSPFPQKTLPPQSPAAASPKLGVGGAVYAQALKEEAQDSSPEPPSFAHMLEPHPEPGPREKSPHPGAQPELDVRRHARQNLERRLRPHPSLAPALPAQPCPPRRFRPRPPAAAAALAAPPTAPPMTPTPAVSSSKQLPKISRRIPTSSGAAGAEISQRGHEHDECRPGHRVQASPQSPVSVACIAEQEEWPAAQGMNQAEREARDASKPNVANAEDTFLDYLSPVNSPVSHKKRSHVVSGLASPTTLGTREVLQTALEQEISPLAEGRLPAISRASPIRGAPEQSNDDRVPVREHRTPLREHRAPVREQRAPVREPLPQVPASGQRLDDLGDSEWQEVEVPSPLSGEQREQTFRRTPLYLRMQRQYQEKENLVLAAAQERRRAEVAGLSVCAVRAPIVRKKTRRKAPALKKVKAPVRRRGRAKKRTLFADADDSSSTTVENVSAPAQIGLEARPAVRSAPRRRQTTGSKAKRPLAAHADASAEAEAASTALAAPSIESAMPEPRLDEVDEEGDRQVLEPLVAASAGVQSSSSEPAAQAGDDPVDQQQLEQGEATSATAVECTLAAHADSGTSTTDDATEVEPAAKQLEQIEENSSWTDATALVKCAQTQAAEQEAGLVDEQQLQHEGAAVVEALPSAVPDNGPSKTAAMAMNSEVADALVVEDSPDRLIERSEAASRDEVEATESSDITNINGG